MSPLIATAAVAIAAIAAAFTFAPRDALRTEITIAAPPAAVWAVLTDTAAYPSWNPFIRRVEGTFTPGTRITTAMHPGGADKGMTFTPLVLQADADRALRWRGRLFAPRIMDAEHSFVLEPTANDTRLIHSETFHGIAMWAFKANSFRPDFDAMNAALKSRVENP